MRRKAPLHAVRPQEAAWRFVGRLYGDIMEKRMETTIVYWDDMGIMEKKMETTIMDYIG